MKQLVVIRIIALFIGLMAVVGDSYAGIYHLDIAKKLVNITGKPVEKITINGTSPGPTLHWHEGESVEIHVTNHLLEPTSLHWHGIILPGSMDGVPGLNGFKGIAPGETFTYRFTIKQSGTYWYHAHAKAQEQDGNLGSIVITPKDKDPVASDRDYVVLISDFSPEKADDILKHLKMDSDYYSMAQRTVGDFFHDVGQKGLAQTWQETRDWGQMRMKRTDLTDVSGYTFLMNGKTIDQNWTGLFKPGEKVKLRFINASGMSIYDVRIPNLKMTVVAADGQNIEPVTVDEFRFGTAETYDVIVQPKENKPYTVVVEPIDRSGFSLGTLAPQDGMRGDIPKQRPRAQLTMADMGMSHAGHTMHHMEGMNRDMRSGWVEAGTPPGNKALDYRDLRYLGVQKDIREPGREITVTLGGNMERYIWTLNGKVYNGNEPIKLNEGERVKLTFINETMMAHPMHLHGMFVQLDNGQPANKLPNKHTVIIPPGQTYSVLLTADQPGEWAFHCHLLYHMLSGMMSEVTVAKFDPKDLSKPVTERVHHHAH